MRAVVDMADAGGGSGAGGSSSSSSSKAERRERRARKQRANQAESTFHQSCALHRDTVTGDLFSIDKLIHAKVRRFGGIGVDIGVVLVGVCVLSVQLLHSVMCSALCCAMIPLWFDEKLFTVLFACDAML